MGKDGRRSRDSFAIVPHAGENAIHLLRNNRPIKSQTPSASQWIVQTLCQ